MEIAIQFIPFTSAADKGWDAAWMIYENSFPYKECRSLTDHLRALKDPRFRADGIWLGEKLAGILYSWCWRDGVRYIEHLALSPELRGQQMGSRALAAFCATTQGTILEIDPPVDEISIRRLHFYERLGFIENPQQYLHPSFRKPFETHKLVLLSHPHPLTDHQVRDFADFVRTEVLCYSEHENPQLP